MYLHQQDTLPKLLNELLENDRIRSIAIITLEYREKGYNSLIQNVSDVISEKLETEVNVIDPRAIPKYSEGISIISTYNYYHDLKGFSNYGDRVIKRNEIHSLIGDYKDKNTVVVLMTPGVSYRVDSLSIDAVGFLMRGRDDFDIVLTETYENPGIYEVTKL